MSTNLPTAANIMRGIAVYADPNLELDKRNYVRGVLDKARSQDFIETRDALVLRFGRETVRAVVGEDEA